MISLDQVYLLEKKVESAVAKIQQLQAENDALRSKCDELTNALSSKSEQLSSFENDQNLIENGIKNALDRLNCIENTVINTVSKNPDGGEFNFSKQQVLEQLQQVHKTETAQSEPKQVPSFNEMEPLQTDTQENTHTVSTEIPVTQVIENPVFTKSSQINQPLDNHFDNSDITKENISSNVYKPEYNLMNDVSYNDSNTENNISNMDSSFEDDISNDIDGDIEESDGLGFDIF